MRISEDEGMTAVDTYIVGSKEELGIETGHQRVTAWL